MRTAVSIEEIESALLAGQHASALELVNDLAEGGMPVEDLSRLAAVLSVHGQNPAAATLLETACVAAPENPKLLADLSQLQWMAGRTEAAIATLRRGLERWPQLQGLYRMLGMQFLTAGRHLDAFMAYSTAHLLSPEDRSAVMGRVCAYRLLSNQRELTVRHGEVSAKFALSGRSLSVDFVHLSGHFYEEAELLALAAIAPRGGTVVDVGANLGNHAVFLLHASAPSELVLFEPNPACVAVLQENLALNQTGARCALHEQGVGSSAGALFFNSHDDLNNGLVPVAQGHAQRVPIVTLDDTVDHADILKIDVEGMELDVLLGAQRLLRESRPVLFVEVQKRNAAAFERLLAEFAYEIHRRFDYDDYSNVIAVAPEVG